MSEPDDDFRDDVPETDQPDDEDLSTPRSPWLRLVLLIVVIAVIGGELLSLLTPDSPASPDATPTLFIAGGDVDFLPASLIYSATEFNLVNTSSSAMDIRGIEFQGANVRLDMSAFRRAALPAGTCIRVLLEGRASPRPAGCREVLTQSVLTDASNFFWTSADGFTVLRDGTLTATCPGVQGRGSVTCSLALPASVDPGV